MAETVTRFGLTAGFGDPLGTELLLALAAKRIDIIRCSLRPDSNITACVEDFVGAPMGALFLLPRLTQVDTQAERVMRAVVERLGPTGADIGIGNESSINGETMEQAVTAVEDAQRIADAVGFDGAIYASSIPNLDPSRDFRWMREFWPRLSREVVRDFHRYPDCRLPWTLDDRHPWNPYSSIPDECRAVLVEAAGAPVSITEFAHSTVLRRWLGQERQVTDADAADYLTQDLVDYARAGFKDAIVFQINSCADQHEWGCGQGIRDANSNWLPQAECFARARGML